MNRLNFLKLAFYAVAVAPLVALAGQSTARTKNHGTYRAYYWMAKGKVVHWGVCDLRDQNWKRLRFDENMHNYCREGLSEEDLRDFDRVGIEKTVYSDLESIPQTLGRPLVKRETRYLQGEKYKPKSERSLA